MGDDMKKIEAYTQALQRFDDKGFYQIEEQIERELDNFQLDGCCTSAVRFPVWWSEASGRGRQSHALEAHLALIDEPTNHMDYIAKKQFIDWMKQAREAMLVITHDRDVSEQVDRIIELKDGGARVFRATTMPT